MFSKEFQMDISDILLLLATLSWLLMMVVSVLGARRNFRQGTRIMAWTWSIVGALVVLMGIVLVMGFSPLFMQFNVH
jgi:hypothetical protein